MSLPLVRCALHGVILLALALPARGGEPSPARWRVELSAGPRFGLGEAERVAFGAAPQVTIGVATAISTSDVWFFLQGGYARLSGDLSDPDPTFEVEESKCRIVPITFGFRTNTVPVARRQATSVYAGIGWMVAPVRLDPAYLPARSTSISGLELELRPEIDLAPRWRAWFRGQITLASSAKFREGGGYPDLQLSSTTLELGIARSFGQTGR